MVPRGPPQNTDALPALPFCHRAAALWCCTAGMRDPRYFRSKLEFLGTCGWSHSPWRCWQRVPTAGSMSWATLFHGKGMVCIAWAFVLSLAVFVCMLGLRPKNISQLETPSHVFLLRFGARPRQLLVLNIRVVSLPCAQLCRSLTRGYRARASGEIKMICTNRFPNLTLLFWEYCSVLVGSLSSANAGSNVSCEQGFVIAWCLTAACAPACVALGRNSHAVPPAE